MRRFEQSSRNPTAWQLWALETPDEKWPTAARIVIEIAGGYGFGNLITGGDQLGHHQILLSDQHGGELRLGSRGPLDIADGPAAASCPNLLRDAEHLAVGRVDIAIWLPVDQLPDIAETAERIDENMIKKQEAPAQTADAACVDAVCAPGRAHNRWEQFRPAVSCGADWSLSTARHSAGRAPWSKADAVVDILARSFAMHSASSDGGTPRTASRPAIRVNVYLFAIRRQLRGRSIPFDYV